MESVSGSTLFPSIALASLRTSCRLALTDRFHVAEDLITTLVTLFIASTVAPSLVDSKVQLVFAEGFGMDANHFTPLWDRMGAWAPRRLSLDPWTEGVCRKSRDSCPTRELRSSQQCYTQCWSRRISTLRDGRGKLVRGQAP